ncbi:hypothetical protein Tco_1547261 [Tanacetum coccineum]
MEGYFTHLLNSNPQQYPSSPNQSNPSTPSSQNSNSSSQPYPSFGTQMTPDQAYQQQLTYHQHQQQVDFQNFANPRNTPPQYFPSQPQFKVPQAKVPRDGRRTLKKASKQPIVNLDEDDDDAVEEKRANTRWNRDKKILLNRELGRTLSEHRRKCEVAEAAHEAKRKKELGMLECRELEFLMIDASSLPPEKAAYIEKKQAEIMRKYPNA